MIYAFNRATNEVLDEFRDIAEAADAMETTQKVIKRIIAGDKTDLDGVGVIEIIPAKRPLRLLRKGERLSDEQIT